MKYRGKNICWISFLDIEVEYYKLDLKNSWSILILFFLLLGLVVLKEVVELGILLGELFMIVLCSNNLFFSNLEFVYIFFD